MSGPSKEPELLYVLAFQSTHDALSAQKKLAVYNPFMIPTPSSIAAGCGFSLQFFAHDEEHATEIMGEAQLDEEKAALYLSDADGCHHIRGFIEADKTTTE